MGGGSGGTGWTGAAGWAAGAFSPVVDLTTTAASNLSQTMKLVLNGHDRFAARPVQYFMNYQVWQYHSGVAQTTDTIMVYSFALKPEEHQPSGTCNFSRIDNASLESTFSGGASCNIFAVNYNVLRIMSGMGGLAYSN